jgi:hypothetical protein
MHMVENQKEEVVPIFAKILMGPRLLRHKQVFQKFA